MNELTIVEIEGLTTFEIIFSFIALAGFLAFLYYIGKNVSNTDMKDEEGLVMDKKTDEIFCKNCKYEWVSDYCKRKYKYEYYRNRNTYTGVLGDLQAIKHKDINRDINENGQCTEYKRKWWKIWIKR